jgi:LacI family gluconate utilization system Gnt-I transcriptional repressor
MTVSRALRNPETVAEGTRRRVAHAVAALRYVPNLSAGTLASGRSRIVGAVVPSITSAFFADTVQGMSDHLHRQGYQLLLANTSYSLEEEAGVTAAFLGRQADAIALTGVEHSPALTSLLRASGLPVVETWDLSEDPIDMQVGFSNFQAARQMTRALSTRGYRRIGFIGVEQGERRAVERLAGYRAATRELDYAESPFVACPFSAAYRGGGQELEQLLERDPDVDAVVFGNDMFAVHALMTCRRHGWDVPRHVAIAGFGGLQVGEDLVPSLTTVRVPGYQIGQTAASMLLRRLAGEAVEPPAVDLGFELVFRESA